MKRHLLLSALCLTTVTAVVAAPLSALDKNTYISARKSIQSGDCQTAVSLLTTLAKSGQTQAQEGLGFCYMKMGKTTEAFRWMTKAAKSGDPSALTNLANAYVYVSQGGKITQDLQKAELLYKQAAEKGSIEAQSNYAALLLQNKQCKEGVYWLKKSIILPRSKYNLGMLYQQGCPGSFPADPKQAFSYMLQAANGDFPDAILNVGEAYAQGLEGAPKDPVQGYVYLKLAAFIGSPVAQHDLAFLKSTMTSDQITAAEHQFLDLVKAKQLVHEAAFGDTIPTASWEVAAKHYENILKSDPTNALAKSRLGMIDLNIGKHDQGAQLMIEAASTGNIEAVNNLAAFYTHGLSGMPVDEKKALALYLETANKGSLAGQNGAGSLLAQKGDYAQAKYWFLKSIAYPPSKMDLGKMYQGGSGVPIDYAKALTYYTQAAEEGVTPAAEVLTVWYVNGTHVQKDIVKAYLYGKLAVVLSGGNQQAIATFNNLKMYMSSNQIAKGEQEFNDFMALHGRAISHNPRIPYL